LRAVAESSGPSASLITGEYPHLTSHVTADCCHVVNALQPRITRRNQVRATYRCYKQHSCHCNVSGLLRQLQTRCTQRAETRQGCCSVGDMQRNCIVGEKCGGAPCRVNIYRIKPHPRMLTLFSAAGPRIWNSLPPELRRPDTELGELRRLLKT